MAANDVLDDEQAPAAQTPPAAASAPPAVTRVQVPGLGLVEFPAGMKPEDMEKAINDALTGDKSTSKTSSAGVWDNLSAGLSSIGNYAKNLWHQVNPYAGAEGVTESVAAHPVANAVAGPVGAMYATDVDARNEIMNRAKAAFAAGHYEDGARLTLDAFIPFLGPGIAHAQDQGLSGDLSGMAGTSTGLALNIAMPAASKVRALPGQGASPSVPEALQTAADSKVAESMVPVSGPNRAEALSIARNVAPTLADQGLKAFTQQGISRFVDNGLTEAGRGINQAEATVPKTVAFGQNDILSRLAALKDKLVVSGTSGSVAPTGYKMAADALDQAMSEVKQTGTINIDNITKFRQAWQTAAADMKAYVKNPTKDITAQGASVAAGAWADAADALNDVVSTKAPQLTQAYQQWGVMRQAQKVLDAADLADTLKRTGSTGAAGITGRFFDAAMASRMPVLAQSRLYQAMSSAIANGNVNALRGAVTALGRQANLSQEQIDETSDALAKVAAGGSK